MKNIEKSFVLGGSDVLINLEPLQRTQAARENEISCATTWPLQRRGRHG
jgi:hypothetical protein